jgi:hypothetical protein
LTLTAATPIDGELDHAPYRMTGHDHWLEESLAEHHDVTETLGLSATTMEDIGSGGSKRTVLD